jgi:hypothetical protein
MSSIKKIIFVALFFISSKGYTQIVARNAVFVELLGSSDFYSVNYDRIFIKDSLIKLSVNIGLGVYPSPAVGPPLTTGVSQNYSTSINLLIGNRRHYLELGAGITYSIGGLSFWAVPRNGKLHPTIGLFIVPRIGYRYQKDSKGFFFRVGFTPLILINDYSHLDLLTGNSGFKTPFFNYMGGLSFGYSF